MIETEKAESRKLKIDFLLDKQDILTKRYINTIYILSILSLTNESEELMYLAQDKILTKSHLGDKKVRIDFNSPDISESVFSIVLEEYVVNGSSAVAVMNTMTIETDAGISRKFLVGGDLGGAGKQYSFEESIASNLYRKTRFEENIQVITEILHQQLTILRGNYYREIKSISNRLNKIDEAFSLVYFDFVLFSFHTSALVGHGIIVPNDSTVKLIVVSQILLILICLIVLPNIEKSDQILRNEQKHTTGDKLNEQTEL